MNRENIDTIKNSFVTKELAEKLKQKGFDLPVIALYDFIGDFTLYDYELTESNLIAPLFSQVIDWLSENHNIKLIESCGFIEKGKAVWMWDICSNITGLTLSRVRFEKLEEAILESLNYVK